MLAALALRLAKTPLQAADFDDSNYLLYYNLANLGLWRPVSKGLPRQVSELSGSTALAQRKDLKGRSGPQLWR